jgi:hypothetical protein
MSLLLRGEKQIPHVRFAAKSKSPTSAARPSPPFAKGAGVKRRCFRPFVELRWNSAGAAFAPFMEVCWKSAGAAFDPSSNYAGTAHTLLSPPSSKGADARSAAGGFAVRRRRRDSLLVALSGESLCRRMSALSQRGSHSAKAMEPARCEGSIARRITSRAAV